MTLSITSGLFMGAMYALSAALAVACFLTWKKRRKKLGVVASICTVVVVVATALGAVNSYFQYFPTLNTLIGKNKDVVALTAIQHRLGFSNASAHFSTGESKYGASAPHGSVVRIPIPAIESHFPARDAEVYLPPIWFDDIRPSLPVVELLHGTPGTPEDWVRGGGVQDVADAWSRTHAGYAPIFVMPDPNGSVIGDTECVDGKQGLAETYLTKDVRNFAISELGASPDPKAWAIGGLSEGGYCGAMLALRHPDMFRTFLDFGGDDHPTRSGGLTTLFSGTPEEVSASAASYDLQHLLDNPAATNGMGGWFTAGAGDTRVAQTQQQIHRLALAKGVDSHLQLVSGGRHTFGTWRQSLAVTFQYTATRIGAVPPVAAATSHLKS